MFCPTCGRDNPYELKFCASCGTNLETITRALSLGTDGAFNRLDASLDQLIARYAERLFKDAPTRALDRSNIITSWQVLGQGALTSLFDLALFMVMTILLPVKFLILLIYTPVRLLSARNTTSRKHTVELKSDKLSELPAPESQNWLSQRVASVTEHTTLNLAAIKPESDKTLAAKNAR